MRLLELSGILIADVAGKLARGAAVGVIAIVCGLTIVIEVIAAARLALVPVVGPVLAHLIIAGAAVVIGAAAIAAVIWSGRSRAQSAREAQEEDPRAAIIAEAISLGYSLGRDFINATPSNAAPASESEADAAQGGRRNQPNRAATESARTDEGRPAA